jgi:hypothetical protein
VPVRRAAFLVLSLCADPRSLCLRLAPPSRRCSGWVQLWRWVCWLLSAAVLSLSGGLLGGLVGSLVSWDANVGWYSAGGYCPSSVLELLHLSCDFPEDVCPGTSFCLGDGLDGGLIVCVYGYVFLLAISTRVLVCDLQC